ncbi:MAG TPA: CRTAC1 family protein, partial [Bryobacteraceae bacterium]|nr:CRTAC1 family protein [Bryobacteraceae bacterium]
LYKGLPNQLLLNKGDGTFQDVSAKWGLRAHVGKGMGVGIADYDRDGKLDLFVPNDALYNFLFHNQGANFEEVGLPANVALVEDGNFISGMGLDFRDFNNDGYPDIAYVALHHQTFPLLVNVDGKEFKEITAQSGLRTATWRMAGFGAGFYDFDQDGWKDLFVTRGHVSSLPPPDSEVDQHNTVFRNPGLKGKWQPLTAEAGLTAAPPSRHRGCAFADLDGDGSIDIVTTALMAESEIWLNQSPGKGNWLALDLQGVKSNRDGIGAEVKVTTKAGDQYNIMTTSVGYASSSAGPVHFGLGSEKAATAVEIRWPSGVLQKLTNVQANQILKVKESAR